MVVNSSRKSSTHRWTTQNRQKSPIAKWVCERHDQPDGVEERDRQGAVEEQVGQVAPALALPAVRRRPRYRMTQPQEHADDQQDLPEPAQVQVLPALGPEQRPGARP